MNKRRKISETQRKNEEKEDEEEINSEKITFNSDDSENFGDSNKDNDSYEGLGSIFSNPNFYKVLIILFLIFILVYLSVSLRYQTYNLPAINKLVEDNFKQNYLQNIENQIKLQNPFLQTSPEGLKKIQYEAQQKFNEVFPQVWNNKTVRDYVNKEVTDIKNGYFRDKSGVTYLMAIDPYYWLRNARNIVEHGYSYDVKINGTYYDLHMLGGEPLSHKVQTKHRFPNILPVLEVSVYKILNFFGFNVELMYAAFITPIIIMALATFFGYLLGKKIAGHMGGFFTALVIAIHPFILTRTIGGFADTDGFNILFPILISWLFLEAVYSKKLGKRSLIYSSLAGLMLFLYSLAWQGWWFIADFILGAGILFIMVLLTLFVLKMWIFKREIPKGEKADMIKYILSVVYISLIFLAVAELFFVFYDGPTYMIKSMIFGPKGAQTLKSIGTLNFWPNVFTTVAELNPGSMSEIYTYNGGKSLFMLVMSGILILPMILVFMNKLKLKNSNDKTNKTNLDKSGNSKGDDLTSNVALLFAVILVYIWFFGTVYATLKGIRFILLLAPAFAVAFGATAGWTNEIFKRLLKDLEVSTKIAVIIVFSLFLLMVFMPQGMYAKSKSVTSSYLPNMDNTWYKLLNDIKLNSSDSAVINSWWDFGHWFKYFANRSVTLDGGGQNKPQAYWLGRTLAGNNELDSVETIRMLDCGGNEGFNTINQYITEKIAKEKGYKNAEALFNNPNVSREDKLILKGKAFKDSMDLINRIITMNKSETQKYLEKEGIPKNYSDLILRYTKCKAPEDFLITSQDMIGKAGVWAHLGSTWNFSKAIYWSLAQRVSDQKLRTALIDDFSLSQKEANAIMYKIDEIKHSPNPSAEANSWIAPWPSYLMNNLESLDINNSMIEKSRLTIPLSQYYDNTHTKVAIYLTNISFSKNNYTDIKANTVIAKGGYGVGTMPVSFSRLIVAENNTYHSYELKSREQNGKKITQLNIDVLLFHPSPNQYYLLIAQPPLGESLFTKLYYLKGYGTKYFNKFEEASDTFDGRTIVWKVKWPFNNN